MEYDLYKYYNKVALEQYSAESSDAILLNSINSPEYTILIPTYKRDDLLKVTISSALNQNQSLEYEILIIDNDPLHNEKDIKGILKGMDLKRISYYKNKKNIGGTANWNLGSLLSRGKYISMIHDDDILSPFFLESVDKIVKCNIKADIIGVNYLVFCSNEIPSFKREEEIKYHMITKKDFFFGRRINIAGMTYKKSMFLRLTGFNEEFLPGIDTAFIFRGLINNGIVVNIDNILAGYRIDNNGSLSCMNEIYYFEERLRKNIAKYENFAKIWMYFFDESFLYRYICGGNKYWNTSINYLDIFKEMDLKKPKCFSLRIKIMSLLLKIESKCEKWHRIYYEGGFMEVLKSMRLKLSHSKR